MIRLILSGLLILQINIFTQISYAQSGILENKVIEFVIAENKNESDSIYLSQKTLRSLFAFQLEHRKHELSDIISNEELDSLENICNKKSELFIWHNTIPNCITLPENRFIIQFDYDTQRIVKRKKCTLFKKNNEVIIKEASTNNLYIKTSPIIEYKNYLLIKVNCSKGLTYGSSCLYIFERNENQDIKLKQKAYCYLH
ncbi:hypothetical protein [Sphingobacterium humi]|uniref:Uncharacterized protein n=1 Tax=Sphingobacterium humi TaxID=1796905 RepID=A0A6N8L361_9SPHI|nr:hypothetical protein [Sphingobacterium humi]MVZ63776.1 hypothetical protein [Sphingobacterium humi]